MKSQLELSSQNGKVELEQVSNSPPILTPERRKDLFSKLNLTWYDDWPVEQQTAMDEVIFAIDELELGLYRFGKAWN